MKIIYLHQYFNTPEMSGGTRSYEMARRMVAQGHEVHMVTSWRADDAKSGADWFQTTEAGIQVHWLAVPYSNQMSYSQRIKAFFAFAFYAKRKAAELDGDIIFATSTPLTIAIPAVLASRKKKIPMVFEVRDLWPEMPIAIGALNNPMFKWAAKQLEKWAYRNSSAVVALSPGMKEGVVRAGFPANQVAVIPNSSDNDEFQYDRHAAARFRDERPWLAGKPLLVYAGTFGKVNGVGYAIDLAKQLQRLDSDIRILLVGDGIERQEVEERAANEGVLNSNLFIEEKVPKKDLGSLLSAATMASNLVTDLPETRANSANKFFDTLAAGKPIFINHGGWMHDIIKEHDCGLAMWRKPISDVARELEEKLHDSEWLRNACQKARELAETRFDRDKLAHQILGVLAQVQSGNNDVSKITPDYD